MNSQTSPLMDEPRERTWLTRILKKQEDRMKKLVIAIAWAVFLHSGSAFAQADVSIDETGCGVLDAAGVIHLILPPSLGGDAVVQSVLTPSGNSRITCNGTLPVAATLPAKGADVTRFDDIAILCSTGHGTTGKWQNVVTKSGRVSLTCHINGQP